MKRIFQITIMVSMAGVMTGCCSPYMVNRGRDAADIFTATLGVGAGAKARIGALQIGALASRDVAGIRNSSFGYWSKGKQSKEIYEYDSFLLPSFWFGIDSFDAGNSTIIQNTSRSGRTVAMKPLPFLSVPVHGDFEVEGINRNTLHHYSQIEAVVALGPSIRVGFNPFELVDFIFGWTTLDIMKDDLINE